MNIKISKYRIEKKWNFPRISKKQKPKVKPKSLLFCPIKHLALPSKIFIYLLLPFPPHSPLYSQHPTTLHYLSLPPIPKPLCFSQKRSKKTNRNNPKHNATQTMKKQLVHSPNTWNTIWETKTLGLLILLKLQVLSLLKSQKMVEPKKISSN